MKDYLDLAVIIALSLGILACALVNAKHSAEILQLRRDLEGTQEMMLDYMEGRAAPGLVKTEVVKL